jgi:RimJ/RimL family protein N-acetyltransferase
MTAVSRRHAAAPSLYTIESLSDRPHIRGLLTQDIAYAAYAIAQLDAVTFDQAEWIQASGPGGRRALLLHSRGGLGPALFAMGDPSAVEAAVSVHPGARFSFGTLRLEHRRVIDRYYMMSRPQLMQRMTADSTTFREWPGNASRLSGADIGAVNRLYSMEGGGSYREDHLAQGVYYGVHTAGDLVSVAGTHAFSADERIAVVGNVFTHPRFRNKGMATAATSAVTAELLRYCDLVVLTVEVQNVPAVQAYEKLGYKAVCNLHESPLIRKEPVGAVSFARRAIARWRGRREGKEVVLR